MKMRAPCSAGALEPETGASRNSAPVPRTMAATAWIKGLALYLHRERIFYFPRENRSLPC